MREINWRTIAVIGVLVLPIYGIEVWHSRWLAALEERTPALRPTSVSRVRDVSARVSVDDATVIGDPAAKVVLIEYSDFHCAFCAKFALQTLPALKQRYVDPGRVRFAFKHFPIVTLHPTAGLTAHAAVCADRDKMFWPLHDVLFASPLTNTRADLVRVARSVGLEPRRFENCLDDPTVLALVQSHSKEASELGLTGTPSFLLGKADGTSVAVLRRIDGAQNVDVFEKVLDELLVSSGANKF